MSKLQSAVADFGTIFLDGKVRLPVAIGCLLLFFGVRPSVRVRRRPPPAKVRNLSSSRRMDRWTGASNIVVVVVVDGDDDNR